MADPASYRPAPGSIPESPGVYRFRDGTGRVIYVGKAKNLRKRLGAYRVANPERFPRRIIRLLHQVTRIEWDECADHSVAGHREELLIAVLQPKFNAAGKVWPMAGNKFKFQVPNPRFQTR